MQDPESFIPERWNPSHPDAPILKELFMPFSLGKRNCIGQNLAMLEIKIFLANIFNKYEFHFITNDIANIEWSNQLTRGPHNVFMTISERE